MRSPFFGDYNYVLSVGGDRRRRVDRYPGPGTGHDPREVGEDDDMDGLDGFQTCTWVPNDIDAASYSSPTIDDPCQSRGGLDQNIYADTAP